MYVIDDDTVTVQYFSGHSGPTGPIPWIHKVPGISNNSVDPTKCHDHTYTVNQNLCSQSNMCHFRIPFTGSGISIFVVQSNDPLNVTTTLDGDTPTITSLAGLSGPGANYNVTLYTVQSLATAEHTLDIALLDYVDSDGTAKGSIIRFDSAFVNDTSSSATVVPQSHSSTGTGTGIIPVPSGSSGSTSPSHSSVSIGPIIGGAIGGLAIIAAIILALLCYRRQQRPSRHAAVIDLQPARPGFVTEQTAFNPPVALYGSHVPSSSVEYSQPLMYATPSRSSIPTTTSDYSNDRRTNSYLPPSVSISSGRTHSTTPSGLVTRNNAVRDQNEPSVETRVLLASPNSEIRTQLSYPTESRSHEAQSSSSPPPIFTRSSEWTEEQSAVLNSLRNANVPPAEITYLMEVMKRQREEDAVGVGSSHLNPIVEAGAPPGYDFKSPN